MGCKTQVGPVQQGHHCQGKASLRALTMPRLRLYGAGWWRPDPGPSALPNAAMRESVKQFWLSTRAVLMIVLWSGAAFDFCATINLRKHRRVENFCLSSATPCK